MGVVVCARVDVCLCHVRYYSSGSYYRGCQTKTVSGRTCQSWSSQSPHKHKMTKAKLGAWKWPEARLINNYCRQPESSKGYPWCYTTDPRKRYEKCRPLKDDRKGLQCELGREQFTMRDCKSYIMKVHVDQDLWDV